MCVRSFVNSNFIMTLLHIPFNSINDLMEKFENIDNSDPNSECFWFNLDNYNFVLINPKHYYGSYGGLIRNTILFTASYRQYSRLMHSLSDEISFVWWHVSEAPLVGTTFISKEDSRVLIPKEIYLKLIKKSNFHRSAGKSSYYKTEVAATNA